MISAQGLTKHYGRQPVVQDVTFACEPGTITGFLGPNGAGKSTTLRMITGLAHPDAGRALIGGQPFAGLPNPTRVVGTLLDSTALHAGRTGRETLQLAAWMAGMPARRVDQVLDQVGLGSRAGERRIGAYSLGMRQRLGLAQALIGDPVVLILDEPANGLDPEGIAWIRGLLRDFADRGGTVLLSSHLLSEVQATVDHLVVIGGGRVAAQGAVRDLLASSGLVVRAADGGALRRMLTDANVPFTLRPDGAVRVETGSDATSAAGSPTAGGRVGREVDAEYIAALAVRAGVAITELRAADTDGLEALFFTLTRSPSPSP